MPKRNPGRLRHPAAPPKRAAFALPARIAKRAAHAETQPWPDCLPAVRFLSCAGRRKLNARKKPTSCPAGS